MPCLRQMVSTRFLSPRALLRHLNKDHASKSSNLIETPADEHRQGNPPLEQAPTASSNPPEPTSSSTEVYAPAPSKPKMTTPDDRIKIITERIRNQQPPPKRSATLLSNEYLPDPTISKKIRMEHPSSHFIRKTGTNLSNSLNSSFDAPPDKPTCLDLENVVNPHVPININSTSQPPDAISEDKLPDLNTKKQNKNNVTMLKILMLAPQKKKEKLEKILASLK